MFIKRSRPQKIKIRTAIKKLWIINGLKIFLKVFVVSLIICLILSVLNFVKNKLADKGFFDLEKDMIVVKGNKYLDKNLILEK